MKAPSPASFMRSEQTCQLARVIGGRGFAIRFWPAIGLSLAIYPPCQGSAHRRHLQRSHIKGRRRAGTGSCQERHEVVSRDWRRSLLEAKMGDVIPQLRPDRSWFLVSRKGRVAVERTCISSRRWSQEKKEVYQPQQADEQNRTAPSTPTPSTHNPTVITHHQHHDVLRPPLPRRRRPGRTQQRRRAPGLRAVLRTLRERPVLRYRRARPGQPRLRRAYVDHPQGIASLHTQRTRS